MKAKYRGTCQNCHREIAIGDEIRKNPGEPARHADCAALPACVMCHKEVGRIPDAELGGAICNRCHARRYGTD